MEALKPFNFREWIDQNRHLLKPPVGNKVVFEHSDFIIMAVGGPNSRKDFHDDPGDEFFYQLEGDMLLKTIQDGRPVDVTIREGDFFLLPGHVHHSPQRFPNTVGLVIERQRRPGERDGRIGKVDVAFGAVAIQTPVSSRSGEGKVARNHKRPSTRHPC